MNILREYLEIITNPAHSMVEFTFILVIDGLFLGVVWPLFKRAVRREHQKIDIEHGVDHPEET